MKTYEEMARDVLARIEEYENERKKHKKNVIRLTAAAVPLCAAAVAGVVLWKGGTLSPEPGQLMNNIPDGIVAETVTTTAETASSAVKETSAASTPAAEEPSVPTETEAAEPETSSPAEEKTETAAGATEQQVTSAAASQTTPQTEAAAEPVTAPPVQTSATAASNTAPAETQAAAPGGGNDVMLRPGDTPSEFRTLISSSPYGVAGDMRAPYNGEVCIGPSVQYAAEEYGDSADYLVMIEIWADNGNRFVTGYNELLAEAERLASVGYISALNTDADGNNWITLQVTYDQLYSISGRADYGYCVFFQSSGSACTVVTPEVNNGVLQ